MKPKLPRFMLWTDKSSMEEFLREPINKRLYYFYLELNNIPPQIGLDGIDQSVLRLYNEIYYQLTKVEYEDSQNFKPGDYIKEIEDNLGIEYSELFGYKMFLAFLLLRENNSKEAGLFQGYISSTYNKTWDERTFGALRSIMKEKKKYSVDLKPYPCSAKSLNGAPLLWDDITNNFDPSSIKEVMNLWSSNEAKITVLKLIKYDYDRIIPTKEGVFHSKERLDQFFSNILSELEGVNLEKKVGISQDNRLTQLEYPFVIKKDLGSVIIEKIKNYVNGKYSPKDKMMPIRAAQDAGVIRRPKYNEIKKLFGENFIGNSSFHDYTNPDKNPYDKNNGFDLMVNEFKKLIE